MTRSKHVEGAQPREKYEAEKSSVIPRLRCSFCGSSLRMRTRGRPQRFCSDACRQAHRKIVATPGSGVRYRTGRVKPKSASEVAELAAEFKPENLSRKSQPRLKCEKVNEVTFKVTGGELTTVPASHGKWGGYRTSKALAWIIKLGPDAWVARCGEQICNPTSFKKAKSQALAMARGSDGDYYVRSPISHLNGLQACLLQTDESLDDV